MSNQLNKRIIITALLLLLGSGGEVIAPLPARNPSSPRLHARAGALRDK